MFKRNRSAVHNWSHRVTLSANMGTITPIACLDVVPGQSIDYQVNALLRTQPLLAPLMHTVDVDIHAFFSPDRLVWDGYEDFHSGGDDGMANVTAPYMTAPAGTGYLKGSLADYLGIPIGVVDMLHSALPFRHYNLIRDTWYRDSQLQTEVGFSSANGLDTTTPRNLLAPCWKRDYFTTCRPQPQLGPEVSIPLTGNADVDLKAALGVPGKLRRADNHNLVGAGTLATDASGDLLTAGSVDSVYDPNNTLEADLSNVSAVDIRDLREAGAVQRFLEFNNIWGGRFIEQIMARWNVRVPDYRLQLPEFLGAGQAKFQFSEVLQTTPGEDTSLGELAGHGVSIVGSNRFKYRAQEHGYIFVFLVIRPKTQYAQGLHRSWSRLTKYDYLLPEFQDIGDQAVLKKEIYADSANEDDVFGYQQMYEEYRTRPSRIAGDFHDTLDYWHMARIFSAEPALNGTFVQANPTDRIFPTTVGVADTLMITAEHSIITRLQLKKRPDYRLL